MLPTASISLMMPLMLPTNVPQGAPSISRFAIFKMKRLQGWVGGSIAKWIVYLLPDPAALGLSRLRSFFFRKNTDAARLINCSALLRVRVGGAKKLYNWSNPSNSGMRQASTAKRVYLQCASFSSCTAAAFFMRLWGQQLLVRRRKMHKKVRIANIFLSGMENRFKLKLWSKEAPLSVWADELNSKN